ncbi:MAG: nucleotidyltransferase domain-containing protein [Chloroflexota bacterium]
MTHKEATHIHNIRQRLKIRRQRHKAALNQEIQRLAEKAAELGVQRVILFGSAAWGDPGLGSDLDLLIIWDTPLDFLARTVELYRCLQPRAPVDLLVYTPAEFTKMAHRPFIRNAIEKGVTLYEA